MLNKHKRHQAKLYYNTIDKLHSIILTGISVHVHSLLLVLQTSTENKIINEKLYFLE